MRVGHLVSSYLHVTENWIHAQMTARVGLTPVVLNRGARLNESLFGVPDGFHLGDLGTGACRREAEGWERHGYSRTFADACRRTGVTVLHAHFGPEGVLGAGLASALRLPLITSFYGYDATVLVRAEAWRGAFQRLFDTGTLFLAEGPALADTLARLGCPAARIRVSPLPVRLPASAAAPGAPLILVVGRLVDKKGVDTSLQVLAHVRRLTTRPFRAVLIGDGPERTRLEQLQQTLALTDCVQFAGAVPPAELDRALGTTTVLLQMSRTAADGDAEGGAPVVVSQALAAGVPVVATRHCDIPWIVRDGDTGFIVDGHDVEGAARRVAEIIERPALRRRLGAAARAVARRRFSMEAVGETLAQHYAEAVALGPVAAIPESLHRSLTLQVAVALRRRAGDAEGLRRVALAASTPADVRGAAARLAGQVHAEQGRQDAAALCFGHWRRLAPSDPHAGLEEARAWLSTDTPARAVTPLAIFVARHPHRVFALSEATALLEAAPAGPRLMPRLLTEAGTPADRLAYDLRSIEAGDRPLLRAGLRRALARYRRGAARRRSPRAQRDAALVAAYLLALRASDTSTAESLHSLWRDNTVRNPLSRYRLASAIEAHGGDATAWARRTFQELSHDHRLPAHARAGARVHVARIDQTRETAA